MGSVILLIIVSINACCEVHVYINRFGVNMTNFPIISRIDAALNNLEAFKIAHPSQQPDCPDEMRSNP